MPMNPIVEASIVAVASWNSQPSMSTAPASPAKVPAMAIATM